MYKYEIYFQSEGHGAKDAFIYIHILKTFSRIQLITINYMTSKQYYIFI